MQEETAALRNFDWTYVRSGVIHVIPTIPACPVRPKSGHSTNARVYEYALYGAAENKSLETKPESVDRAALRCSLCPACAWPAPRVPRC